MARVKITTTVDLKDYELIKEKDVNFAQLIRIGLISLDKKENTHAEIEKLREANIKIQKKLTEVSAKRFEFERQIDEHKELIAELRHNNGRERRARVMRDLVLSILKERDEERKEVNNDQSAKTL